MKISTVDLFCGAGGLTHGFVLEGVPVSVGIDMDPACRFPYEANNDAEFVERDISKVSIDELNKFFGDADLRILAGCAPCQPFSTYAQRYELDGNDGKWGLLYEFARLAQGAMGFTPVFTDTYEKADRGHEECSCRSEGSSVRSSSAVRLSRRASRV